MKCIFQKNEPEENIAPLLRNSVRERQQADYTHRAFARQPELQIDQVIDIIDSHINLATIHERAAGKPLDLDDLGEWMLRRDVISFILETTPDSVRDACKRFIVLLVAFLTCKVSLFWEVLDRPGATERLIALTGVSTKLQDCNAAISDFFVRSEGFCLCLHKLALLDAFLLASDNPDLFSCIAPEGSTDSCDEEANKSFSLHMHMLEYNAVSGFDALMKGFIETLKARLTREMLAEINSVEYSSAASFSGTWVDSFIGVCETLADPRARTLQGSADGDEAQALRASLFKLGSLFDIMNRILRAEYENMQDLSLCRIDGMERIVTVCFDYADDLLQVACDAAGCADASGAFAKFFDLYSAVLVGFCKIDSRYAFPFECRTVSEPLPAHASYSGVLCLLLLLIVRSSNLLCKSVSLPASEPLLSSLAEFSFVFRCAFCEFIAPLSTTSYKAFHHGLKKGSHALKTHIKLLDECMLRLHGICSSDHVARERRALAEKASFNILSSMHSLYSTQFLVLDRKLVDTLLRYIMECVSPLCLSKACAITDMMAKYESVQKYLAESHSALYDSMAAKLPAMAPACGVAVLLRTLRPIYAPAEDAAEPLVKRAGGP